jgi:hypothetical protein
MKVVDLTGQAWLHTWQSMPASAPVIDQDGAMPKAAKPVGALSRTEEERC